MRVVQGPVPLMEAHQLKTLIEKLTAENVLLKAETINLQNAIHVEKKRMKRGKPIVMGWLYLPHNFATCACWLLWMITRCGCLPRPMPRLLP